MRTLMRGLGVVVLLCCGGQASAAIDAISVAPAATVLLPYFEVDPNGTDASGVDTLLTINNASATAILGHVTIWTDLAVPVMGFQIYFTGYDVETIDLSEVLAGRLPRTASDGQDPQDEITPQGDLSQDINFASCTGILPPPQSLSSDFVTHVRNALTGQQSDVLGGCAGRNLGDGIMRGYVTVDTVNSCSLLLPNSPGFYQLQATQQNTLYGSYLTIDRGTKRARGGALVGVQTSFVDPEVTVPGEYTFYGRLHAFNASDRRQPLATTFGVRYVNGSGSGFPTATYAIVWRDPKVPQNPFACGTTPPWYPLGQEALVVFNDQEEPEVQMVDPVAPVTPGAVLTPFPAATQKVLLGGADFPLGFERGWIYMNLNTTIAGSPNPPEDPAAAQAWVEVVYEDRDPGAYGVRGRTATAHPAAQFDSATNASHVVFGP